MKSFPKRGKEFLYVIIQDYEKHYQRKQTFPPLVKIHLLQTSFQLGKSNPMDSSSRTFLISSGITFKTFKETHHC